MGDAGDVARILQRGLAPPAVPEFDALVISARYRAGGHNQVGEVGGDWYDVLDLPDAGVAIVIGDVAGHGVAAATTMGHLQHALRAYLVEDDSPSSVLCRLNRLAQWMLPGEIATAAVAVVDDANEQVTIASAGHPPPVIIKSGSAAVVALDIGPAVGVVPEPQYPETVLPLESATLVLFTDGLVERRGESIDDGLARLREVAAAPSDGTGLLDRLLDQVPDPNGNDDLAVVAFRRKAT